MPRARVWLLVVLLAPLLTTAPAVTQGDAQGVAPAAAPLPPKLAAYKQEVAQSIQDSKIEFSIDQQPYVQGYLAVQSIYLNLKNGNDIGGGQPTLTGPSFVDSSNIDTILPFAEKNTR